MGLERWKRPARSDSVYVCVCSCTHTHTHTHTHKLTHVWFFVTLWSEASQAPLSMEFSRLEYWSGLLFPSSGDLLDPQIEPASPALAGEFLTTELPWEA